MFTVFKAAERSVFILFQLLCEHRSRFFSGCCFTVCIQYQ